MNGRGSACGGRGGLDPDGTTRVIFFDGQRLEADDLNGAADQMRQLRWLHNRSLHGWGIGLGFDAIGNAGDRRVTVRPGYAIDCLGRELVLTDPATLAVPARSGNDAGQPVAFALVAAYPDESRLVAVQTRAADCGGTAGAVRLRERAAVYWREPPVTTGIEILLATATVQNCQLALPLAVDQARRARALTTPYVYADETAPGGTPWQPWIVEPAREEPFLLGVKAVVDTGAARFGATPAYQAQLRGPRYFDQSIGDTDPPILLDGTVIVGEVAPASFTAFVHMPRLRTSIGLLNPDAVFNDGPDGRAALLGAIAPAWTVAWLGVET